MVNIMDAFEKALDITLGHEGGFSDDALDSGGKTNWGITEKVAKFYGYAGKMEDFTVEDAKHIYRIGFWHKNRLDEIAEYYDPIAVEMFDTGVNMGAPTAARFMQRAINCLNRDQTLFDDLVIDGVLGSKTIDALGKLSKLTEKRSILKMINALQGTKYIEICEKDPSQEKFIRGWLKRVP